MTTFTLYQLSAQSILSQFKPFHGMRYCPNEQRLDNYLSISMLPPALCEALKEHYRTEVTVETEGMYESNNDYFALNPICLDCAKKVTTKLVNVKPFSKTFMWYDLKKELNYHICKRCKVNSLIKIKYTRLFPQITKRLQSFAERFYFSGFDDLKSLRSIELTTKYNLPPNTKDIILLMYSAEYGVQITVRYLKSIKEEKQNICSSCTNKEKLSFCFTTITVRIFSWLQLNTLMQKTYTCVKCKQNVGLSLKILSTRFCSEVILGEGKKLFSWKPPT